MKYRSKEHLLRDIRSEHDALCSMLGSIHTAFWAEPGVWGDGWTVTDLVSHLAEWQKMFLGWYETGLNGQQPQMPTDGYKWNETPRLNRAIREKHRSLSPKEAMEFFDDGYEKILEKVDGLSERQLLEPGQFAWTGKYPLTTYLGPNTASHYRFAMRVLKRWQRERLG